MFSIFFNKWVSYHLSKHYVEGLPLHKFKKIIYNKHYNHETSRLLSAYFNAVLKCFNDEKYIKFFLEDFKNKQSSTLLYKIITNTPQSLWSKYFLELFEVVKDLSDDVDYQTLSLIGDFPYPNPKVLSGTSSIFLNFLLKVNNPSFQKYVLTNKSVIIPPILKESILRLLIEDVDFFDSIYNNPDYPHLQYSIKTIMSLYDTYNHYHDELVYDTDIQVRVSIAMHSSNMKLLKILATDINPQVRANILKNEHIDYSVLKILSDDVSHHVLYGMCSYKKLFEYNDIATKMINKAIMILQEHKDPSLIRPLIDNNILLLFNSLPR